MVDQSGLGMLDGETGTSLAEFAATIVNICITEMVNIATKPVGEYDEEVQDYFYIYIWGYGGDYNNNVNLLYQGFISDVAYNNPYEDVGPFHIIQVVKPVVGYDSPMATAFEKVRECIVDWKNNGHNGEDEVSPLIINVTHGEILFEQVGNSKNDIYMSARSIIEISFPDGPPLICNIITSKKDSEDTPSFENQICRRETFQQLLSSISSSPTDRMYGFEKKKLLFNVNDVYDLNFFDYLVFSWGGSYAKPPHLRLR